MKKVCVALTGASGNMGRETLKQLAESTVTDKIRILVCNSQKDIAFAKSAVKEGKGKVEAFVGDISDINIVKRLLDGADYIFNLAAVIPPLSDHEPEKTRLCNYVGVKNIVEIISKSENKPKLVHISSVAVYGNRNYLHPWGRVGDPLLPSVYDLYAANKVKAERIVLESGLKHWAILRQTAMLHDNMFSDNMRDGLMFHTCFNVPLEWVTARDSGVLIRRILESDAEDGAKEFWRRVYNIGGGDKNRCTGYDTFNEGFKHIGGSAESLMNPGWNSIRNFHGLWFYDGDVLDKMFPYITESISEHWKRLFDKHAIYKLGRFVPPSLISAFAIKRLLPDENSPTEWVRRGDAGKIAAYFGSRENLECMPRDWKDYAVLAKGELADAFIDYEQLRDVKQAQKLILSHGYDESKPDSELGIEDMKEAAAFRGGECLSESMTKGDLYTPLRWKCCDGHEFSATPYTVLKAGHWCPVCCQPEPWDFDRLSKLMPFFAQVWYDTHSHGENCTYYFDKSGKARFTRFTPDGVSPTEREAAI